MFDLLERETDRLTPPDVVAPEDLGDELAAVLARIDRLQARVATLVSRAAESGVFRRDGYSSMTALLKHRMAMHPGEAHRLVTRANGLSRAPVVAAAFEAGLISTSQVDVLLEAGAIAPLEIFNEAEPYLVDLAMATPLIRDLRKRLDYWLDKAAADDLESSRLLVREIRSLTLRRDGEMIRINGWVDIEAGERLRAVLEPGPPAESDTRSTPARRADLLIDIVSGASDRPELILHVSSATLLGEAGGVSETGHGSFLTGDEIRRIACDANLRRVILDPASQPLDVGRARRLVTPAIRAAVIARDLRCVFPGCDRPAHWCDVHHLRHWAEGGGTEVGNLVLLCRHHHTLVHEGGWRIEGPPGSLRFVRPDGSELEIDLPRSVASPNRDHPPRLGPPIGIQALVRRLPRLRGP